MIVSRILPRWRVDVPPEVQQALGVRPGDLLRYDIVDGRVTVSKGNPSDSDDGAVGDETLDPIVDAALRDTAPALTGDALFAELHARIDARRGPGRCRIASAMDRSPEPI